MTSENKLYQEITNWLNNPIDINEGMRLHTLCSKNIKNKRVLAFQAQKRKFLLPLFLREIVKNFVPVKKKEAENNTVNPQSIVETKLRKEFPKIVFKDLPEALKKLVFVRYDAWAETVKQHALQHMAVTDQERFVAAKATVTNIIENWQIWDELNNWHKYNKVLGKHPALKENEFLTQLSELEAKGKDIATKEYMMIRRRARNNIHILLRMKKLTEKQEKLLTTWIEKHDIVSQRLNEPLWEK